jgi:hypothetical protein
MWTRLVIQREGAGYLPRNRGEAGEARVAGGSCSYRRVGAGGGREVGQKREAVAAGHRSRQREAEAAAAAVGTMQQLV